MKIEITAREAAATVLAAHAAGRLTAQAPRAWGCYFTRQEGKVYRCAVGQLFSEDEAKQLENGPAAAGYLMADGLIEDGVIVTDDPAAIAKMQDLHDAWASRRERDSEQQFLAFVRGLVQ